jgi:hypothetical protein
LLDLTIKLVDSIRALQQQIFPPAHMPLFVCEVAAQAGDGGAQPIVFLEQVELGLPR